MPCVGQVSNAASRLSWTTSSAMSKLPIMRTMAPVSFAASSRKTAASAASVAVRVCLIQGPPRTHAFGSEFVGILRASAFHDRPDFDAPSRPRLRHLESLIEIGHVDHRKSADDLLGLDERTVGHHRLAGVEADGGSGLRALQLLASYDFSGLNMVGEPFTGPFVLSRELRV